MTSHVIFETDLIMCLNFWQVTVKNDDCQHTKIQYCIWSSVLFGWGHTDNEKCYFIAPYGINSFFVCTIKVQHFCVCVTKFYSPSIISFMFLIRLNYVKLPFL